MKKTLKILGASVVCGERTWPTRLTKKQDLQSLMDRLQPVTTDKELIRMGPDGDGGYLVPNDLDDIGACFSPGVSSISGFETECAKHGMHVFLADKSVDGPAESHDRFTFTKKYVGVTTNDDFMTMDNWVEDSLPGTHDDLLLQIDIEGFEYEVFLGASDALMQRFRIIVVEFHHIHELMNRPFFRLASSVFNKLLQTHACVHHHPNNCCGSVKLGNIELPKVTELTFLRHDRIKTASPTQNFPHPLDYDNESGASLPLPSCWYRQ